MAKKAVKKATKKVDKPKRKSREPLSIHVGEGKPFLLRFAPGLRADLEKRQLEQGFSTLTGLLNQVLRQWNDGQPPLPKD